MKNAKKLYLVKREVYASSTESAVKSKGRVYEITLADEKYQPAPILKAGFNVKKPNES